MGGDWIAHGLAPPIGTPSVEGSGEQFIGISLQESAADSEVVVHLPPNGVGMCGFGVWRATETGEREHRIYAISHEQAIPAGRDQKTRESLQVEAFLAASIVYGGSWISSGAEPPDFIISGAWGQAALEVTELTIEQMRDQIAFLQSMETKVALAIHSSADYDHLHGRRASVDLRAIPARSKGKRDLIAAVVATLRADVGESVPGRFEVEDGGVPLPGLHLDDAGKVWIRIERAMEGRPPEVLVRLVSGTVLMERELRSIVENAVRRKDRPENEVLLISTGVPGDRGTVCGADWFLYLALGAYRLDFRPNHLREVYLHHWPDGDVVTLYP